MSKKKVVVAFSGGLDTSFTVMYLAKEKGYEVYAASANTGGFSEEQLKTNEENAYKLGAVKYVTLDVTREYYEKSLKYMVYGNVLRNGTYPISVSSERICLSLICSALIVKLDHFVNERKLAVLKLFLYIFLDNVGIFS